MLRAPESQLEQEIREQPDVLEGRSPAGWLAAREAVDLLQGAEITHLVIAARGSSDNAARYAQYMLGLDARLPVGLATPWLYASDRPPLLRGAGVLAISQSGRSPDVVSVVQAAQEQGRPTVALTNDVRSPLAAAADVVVPMLAGPELSVAATKTYLASLHAIAQISSLLGGNDGRMEWFARLPELLRGLIDAQLEARAQFDRLADTHMLTVVGRGLNLGTAFETALKLRELSGLPAEAFSLPDLLHGPVAALRPDDAIWLISIAEQLQPTGAEFGALRQLAGLGIAVSDNAEIQSAAEISIPVARELPMWLTPMLAVIPAQAAALRLAELKGGDVDRPEGLTKVTLTQ
jgi:glutamine---fructose-6-phosphate transaminase (isomerizing)